MARIIPSLRIFQVDAFTEQQFTGNPATVVLEADELDDAAMAAIAREFAHAEVAFVAATTASDHDVRMRFFNARKEAPFVGHATIAAHAVLFALGRRGEGRCRQHSGTGIIDIRTEMDARGRPVIAFRQTLPEFDPPLPFETTLRIAGALRLPASRLHDALPARLARKGSTRVLVPVGDAAALDVISPEFDTLIALGQELGTDGFFVFAVDRGAGSLSTDSRMFCPAIGIPEDPVSGNAHSMLASYLWQYGQVPEGTTGFMGRQGRWMQRPGQVAVKLEIDSRALIAVHIGGTAVIVSEGSLLPSAASPT